MAVLLYIVCGFLAFGLIFDRATRKYLNPYKLYFIFGKKGAFKALDYHPVDPRHLWPLYQIRRLEVQ